MRFVAKRGAAIVEAQCHRDEAALLFLVPLGEARGRRCGDFAPGIDRALALMAGRGQRVFDQAIDEGKEALLQEMYEAWPFFRSTLSLIEMVLAKSDEVATLL